MIFGNFLGMSDIKVHLWKNTKTNPGKEARHRAKLRFLELGGEVKWEDLGGQKNRALA